MITNSKRNFLKRFFSVDDNQLNQFIGKAAEIFNSLNEEDGKTYLRMKGTTYQNGEICEEYDKEYVNGECVKDEQYVKPIENKEEVNETETQQHDTDNKEDKGRGIRNKSLRKSLLRRLREDVIKKNDENETLKSQIHEMAEYIDGLNDKIKKLEIEKSEIKSVLDNIKKAFN